MRIARLVNEVETTQQEADAYRAELAHKDEEFDQKTAQLRRNGEGAARELKRLHAAYAELEEEHAKLQEASSAEIEELQGKVTKYEEDREKEDTENAILLRLLHAELDKYKVRPSPRGTLWTVVASKSKSASPPRPLLSPPILT